MVRISSILLVCILSVFCIAVNSCRKNEVTPEILWERTYSKWANNCGFSVQQTTDGGYVVVGVTFLASVSLYDVWLIKTDSLGDTLWTRTCGGAESDWGMSVQQTSDRGYIIVGWTDSFGSGSEVYVVRTNAQGDIMWERTYGGESSDQGYSVLQTPDGGFVIAGLTHSFGAGATDVYFIRTDYNGDTLWTKTYGGSGYESAYCVEQTSDGGYVITGQTSSRGAGETDLWLLRTDSNGDTIWTKTYGGDSPERGRSVQQTLDGGYVIVGETFSNSAGYSDVYLVKTDSLGNTEWARAYGESNGDIGYSVQETRDGGYIIAGVLNDFGSGIFEPKLYLIRTDGSGNSVWTATYDSSYVTGHSVEQTFDGKYVITGSTWHVELFLIKIDADK